MRLGCIHGLVGFWKYVEKVSQGPRYTLSFSLWAYIIPFPVSYETSRRAGRLVDSLKLTRNIPHTYQSRWTSSVWLSCRAASRPRVIAPGGWVRGHGG